MLRTSETDKAVVETREPVEERDGGPQTIERTNQRTNETRSLPTVDHSARGSMKDAASCEKWCDLQSTLIVDNLNVHYGSAFNTHTEPRPPQGLCNIVDVLDIR